MDKKGPKDWSPKEHRRGFPPLPTTPGPWTVDSGRAIESEDGLVAVAHSRPSAPHWALSRIEPTVADDNVYLLGAAPELEHSLNRLATLLAVLDEQGRLNIGPHGGEFAQAMTEATALLERLQRETS